MEPIASKICISKESYIKSIVKSNLYNLLGNKLNCCDSPELLLKYDSFVKIIALGNACNCPLTENYLLKHDMQVIAKSIKYCIKYKSEETEKYYDLALTSILALSEGNKKAKYYLLLADAVRKTDPKGGLTLALEAVKILKVFKKWDADGLRLKAIKILVNLDPQIAYKVIKLYSDNDRRKISAIYQVYKKCEYKTQKKCFKKLQKLLSNEEFLHTPEKLTDCSTLGITKFEKAAKEADELLDSAPMRIKDNSTKIKAINKIFSGLVDPPDNKNPFEIIYSLAEMENVSAQYLLGVFYESKMETHLAVQAFEKAANQGHLLSLIAVGTHHFLEGSFTDALKNYKKAAELGENSAYEFMGHTYKKMSLKNKALECFKKAIEFDNSSYQYIGAIYEEWEDYDKALEAYSKIQNPHIFLICKSRIMSRLPWDEKDGV